MQIFTFFFDILSEIYRVCNRDFFGLGFGYMDFILASLLLVTLIKFSFNGSESLSHGNITDTGLGIFQNKQMTNEQREREIARKQREDVHFAAMENNIIKHIDNNYKRK